MDQKSKSELPPLPTNDDDFWKEAENEICKVKPAITCDVALHKFIRKSGTEAKCLKCPVGYYLRPDMTVRDDGHIYMKGEFVI